MHGNLLKVLNGIKLLYMYGKMIESMCEEFVESLCVSLLFVTSLCYLY